jgi:hypothetical protein
VDIESRSVVLGETVNRFVDPKHNSDAGENQGLRAFVETAVAKICWNEAATTNPEPHRDRHIYAIEGIDGVRPIWPCCAAKSRKGPGMDV